MRNALVSFVTWQGLPDLSTDDRLAVAALAARGVAVNVSAWDDPEVWWEAFDLVVVRSCWDYHHREAEFARWLDRLDMLGARTWNPTALLRWNMDKAYLREVAARGVPVVRTRWVTGDDAPPLATVLAAEGWTRAVVKPTVSASAHATFATDLGSAVVDEARYRAIAGRGALVQGFVDTVVTDGEWSLLFFGGRFSHAVLKRPRAGDFRVQSEFGGSATLTTAPPALVRQAERALAAAPGPWLYARVDGCVVDGTFVLMELELLEPSLFLEKEEGAADRFADAIVALLVKGDEPR